MQVNSAIYMQIMWVLPRPDRRCKRCETPFFDPDIVHHYLDCFNFDFRHKKYRTRRCYLCHFVFRCQPVLLPRPAESVLPLGCQLGDRLRQYSSGPPGSYSGAMELVIPPPSSAGCTRRSEARPPIFGMGYISVYLAASRLPALRSLVAPPDGISVIIYGVCRAIRPI